MRTNEHLDLIKLHAHAILEEFNTATGAKSSEIRTDAWAILDETVRIGDLIAEIEHG